MWYEISHVLALITGGIIGTLTSIDFILVWCGVYYAFKNTSKLKRHFFGIIVGLIIHAFILTIIQNLTYI